MFNSEIPGQSSRHQKNIIDMKDTENCEKTSDEQRFDGNVDLIFIMNNSLTLESGLGNINSAPFTFESKVIVRLSTPIPLWDLSSPHRILAARLQKPAAYSLRTSFEMIHPHVLACKYSSWNNCGINPPFWVSACNPVEGQVSTTTHYHWTW